MDGLTTFTAAEVAGQLRCSTHLIRSLARRHGVGIKLGGRAGWRFTTADIDALVATLAPPKPVEVPRRRRRRGF